MYGPIRQLLRQDLGRCARGRCDKNLQVRSLRNQLANRRKECLGFAHGSCVEPDQKPVRSPLVSPAKTLAHTRCDLFALLDATAQKQPVEWSGDGAQSEVHLYLPGFMQADTTRSCATRRAPATSLASIGDTRNSHPACQNARECKSLAPALLSKSPWTA